MKNDSICESCAQLGLTRKALVWLVNGAIQQAMASPKVISRRYVQAIRKGGKVR